MFRAGNGVVGSLIWFSFARGVASSTLITFLPLYAYSLGYSLVDIGFFSMIGSGVSVLVLPFVGFAGDVYGRKPIALLSGLMVGMSLVIPLLMPNYVGFLLAYSLLHSSFMSWQPARGAMIADAVSEDHLGDAFARVSMAFAVTRIIVPYLVGVAIVNVGYAYVFGLVAVLVLASTLLFSIYTRETASFDSQRRRGTLGELLRSLVPKREEVGLHLVLGVDRAGWRLWMPLLSPYLKDVFGLDEGGVGALTTLRGLMQAILLGVSGRFVDRYGFAKALAASEVLGALSAVALIVGGNPLAPVLAMTFIGASIALRAPAYNVGVAVITRDPSERARVYGRVNMSRTAVGMPMPWVGGFLSDVALSLPFTASAATLLINTLLILLLGQKSAGRAKHALPAGR